LFFCCPNPGARTGDHPPSSDGVERQPAASTPGRPHRTGFMSGGDHPMFTTISITRPSLVDQLLEQFERTGALPSIGGGDHPPADPPADPPKDPKDPPADPPKDDDVTFDEKQQKKLNDLLAAERKKTEERLATEAAAQAQREKEQRERDEAEKR